MRILAIRGSNLASLSGPFAVELDALPLSGSGLFAITGNTGAGKSTILDALCLALFDRMPRLPEGQGVEVGRREEQAALRLKSNDVRSILRRGAAEGHAEVDFRGNDGRGYRARWTVRRARGRAEGRLQHQTLELQELESGQPLGRTKTEVLEQIRARLGLSFEQFRRSALLAQGDFAAFLKARSAERAALLERITGTEIYGELSKAAHGRAGEERRALELQQQRLGEHRPLAAEQRGLLETECKAAKALLEQKVKEQTRLATARQWYLELAKLEAEQAEARQALDAAGRAWKEAVPRRERWRRIRDLQPLRGPLRERDRTAAELEQAGTSLARARDQEQKLVSAVEAATKAAEQARAGFHSAEARLREAEPLLKQARILDTRIDAARLQLATLRSGQETAEAKAQQTGQALESLDSRLVEMRAAEQEAESWLAGHAHLAPLAEQWDGWRRELERYGETRARLDAEAKVLGDACRRIEASLRERAAKEQVLESSGRTFQEREQAVRLLEQQAERLDLQTLANGRQSLQERERRLTGLKTLCSTAVELRARLESSESTLQACLHSQITESENAQGLAADIARKTASRDEAQGALQRLLLANAADVETLRGGLTEAEPCPVCGSLEHPWAGRAHAVPDQLVEEQRARADELEAEVGGLREARSRAESDAAHAGRRARELKTEKQALQQQLDKTLEAWSGSETDPLRPDAPFAAGLTERLDEALQKSAVELEVLRAEENRGQALLKELETGRRQLESARKDRAEREQALRAVDEQLREAEQQQDQAQRERSGAQAELEQLQALLTEPLAGIDDWRVRLDADAGAFLGQCEQQAGCWHETAGRRTRAEKKRIELEPRLAEARERRDGASTELAEKRRMVEGHFRQLQQLEKERAGLLDGRPADGVEGELRQKLDSARETLEAARKVLSGRREALAGAMQLRQQGERKLEQCRRDAEQADGSLARLLTERGINPEALREALGHDHDWVEAERKALDELHGAVQQAQALQGERSGRTERHREADAPAESAERIEALLAEFRDALEQARDVWAGLKGRLEQDDERRKTSSMLQQEEEQQLAVCKTWDSLKELIGSADGSKFRSFAQGLTLRLLLAHANIHLRDLARRYLLEPVPGEELELQVIDRVMGDEVRSVHSLSGGESFLVSLALALGLASLASERVQVESLFIDEGFGALDAEALDMAIASLDTLYSLGRQVGVISHVPTLVERIGAQVRVESRGGGRSRVRVVGL